ncbi:DUF4349 domain-containing protein [Micromonospora sp. NBC_01813]|uniref:DUF4349 domain-containing protein n=1 Tax=Micromonospora sp. NBC_01813 TaxID=2975988 RepID=UPI002DDB0C16|nr:DUF4349 domain-containing protein [Micromonospora sp. NBC_01813]WSA06158.1 DUF4349 domain-containing protein [Micromonospora sp. NBC_01813]
MTNTQFRQRIGGRRGVAAATVALLGLLILTGCSASSDESASDASGGEAVEMPQRAEAGAPPPDGADGGQVDEESAPGGRVQFGDRDGTSPVDLQVGNRSIIYAGSLTVQVEDLAAKASEATTIATSAGGFVGRDQRSEYGSHGRATLELRVPAAEFDRVVQRLSGLGEETSRELSVQDVTEEVIDLEARIATQEARVRSGRALLAEAETLADLVLLEGELAKREADLASLQAKQRGLDDLVTLSRITVELVGPDAPPAPEEESELGFLAGLAAGWKAFVASLRVLVTVFGALLPWLIALGVPAVGIFLLLRRLNRRSRAAGGAAAPAAVGPPPSAGGGAVPGPRADADDMDPAGTDGR